MALTTSVLQDGPVSVLVLDGELDLAVVPALDADVARCQAGGSTHLVLDATRLGFCDSNGLGALIRYARQSGPDAFLLAGASGGVRRLIELTGTQFALGLRSDVSAAITEAHDARTSRAAGS